MIVPLLIALTVTVLLFILSFFLNARRTIMERTIRSSNRALDISVQNIDYYLGQTVDSIRSIYINPETLTLLNDKDNKHFNREELKLIQNYLTSIYYSNSHAQQIVLKAFKNDQSFLLVPKDMQFSRSKEAYESEQLKSDLHLSDVRVEATHPMHTYNHIIGFSHPKSKDNFVFTISVPIFNLPDTRIPIALLLVDFPIDFLNKNCELAYAQGERMDITDRSGKILASSENASVNHYAPWHSIEFQQFNTLFIGNYNNNLVLKRDLNSQYLNWTIYIQYPMATIYKTIFKQMKLPLITAIFALLLLTAFNIFYIMRYTKSIEKISHYMDNLITNNKWNDENSLSAIVDYNGNDEIKLLIDSFESMIEEIQNYIKAQYQLEINALQADMRTLQMQINPHFIYNTLQSFATQTLNQKDLKLYKLISSFGQMLHYAMELDPVLVDLKSDVSYSLRYIALQEMRFKYSIDTTVDIEKGCETFKIPRMTLQPIIENSIIHGKLLENDESVIIITAYKSDDFLCLEVHDNGLPIADKRRLEVVKTLEKAKESYPHTDASQSIGLVNTYCRLLLYFGSDSSMDIYSNNMDGTTVCIKIKENTDAGDP